MAEQESTRRMMTPTGKWADVPFSRVKEAMDDGLEFGEQYVTPSGKLAWIAPSQRDAAESDGLKPSGIPQVYSPYEKQLQEQRTKKALADESLSDKFQRNFMSGGGNDVRNMAAAVGGAAPAQVGQLLSRGAASVEKNAPAALASGRQTFQQIANSSIGKTIASGASMLYGGAKWLGDKAAIGAATYYGMKALDEAKKAKNDIFGE